jgi:hypothetical protein
MSSHQEPAEGMQVRLTFQAVHEDRQGRFNRRVAKVLQAGPTPRVGAQSLAF